jgi:hypothetical protein|tara:strand:- start:268 stop:423 length:156 start_codon:yes stop_codon:yes gene_type:complete
MFSDEMKIYLPVEKTMDFLKGLNKHAGKITASDRNRKKSRRNIFRLFSIVE